MIKNSENEYDSEAIKVQVEGLDKVGYAAHSPYTRLGQRMSADRLYDKINDITRWSFLFEEDNKEIQGFEREKEEIVIHTFLFKRLYVISYSESTNK